MMSSFHGRLAKRHASKRKPPPDGTKVVVVGNGMVGAKFCEELVTLNLHQKLSISVIGAEPIPAYNRVKLSSYVESRDSLALELLGRDWYEEHQISLTTGIRVQAIDREEKTLSLSDGSLVSYDILVLAKGSRPFVPPIPGVDQPSVFLYRSVEDLKKIIKHADGKTSATVIGGGLLGIEAAQALQALGLTTSIVERARFLMPQQLTQPAGQLLQEKVEEQNIQVHTGIHETIIKPKDQGLELTLNESELVQSDFLVISAGIRPNSEIAESAGLPVGVRGGIVVNDDLETEDPSIFAIGECALLHGRTYGLVAPGNVMAKHLARRLAGKKQRPLAPLDLSTRLKMLGVDVVSIGEPLQEGRQLEFTGENCYRSITIGQRQRIVGALGVGPWEEGNAIHSAFQQEAKISPKQERYFQEEGLLFPGTKVEDPSAWPESRVVCNCTSTRKGTIMACLEKCQNDPDRVSASTGASSVCGSCRPLLEQLCGAAPTAGRPGKSVAGLLIASAIALAITLYTLAGPPAKMATSVESTGYQIEQLWRDHILKQISGYSLMAIFTLGLLISLRKRLTWFKWGKFASWRFFHAAFGLTSLAALWIHTGFHFGANLNWWLMFVFVALNLLGAVAGIAAAMEARSSSERARRLRPLLTRTHLILFWPLPVLLTFHILSAYLY